MFGARFGMRALNVLTHHDQRHEEDLDYVGNEQPEHESHRGIELQGLGRERVPT